MGEIVDEPNKTKGAGLPTFRCGPGSKWPLFDTRANNVVVNAVAVAVAGPVTAPCRTRPGGPGLSGTAG